MEFSFRTWWRVTVVIMVSLLLKSARGRRVECWECAIENDSDACKTAGVRYYPEVAVTDTFCDNLRGEPELVGELCKTYPTGYKVVCLRTASVTEEICSSDYCPVESKSSHQIGSSAISQHAPNMVFATAAVSCISMARMLL